jgi:CHAT domain-containing protein
VEVQFSRATFEPVPLPVSLREQCDNEVVKDRDAALNLLVTAKGSCLDRALELVETHSKQDLAAAYLIRAERNDDPIDLLRATETAKGFNRALALEELGLEKEAIGAWDEVVEEPKWGAEARQKRDALMKRPDPAAQWPKKRVDEALARGDRSALTAFAAAFPADAVRYFERFAVHNRAHARLLAEVLSAQGDQFPRAVVEAMERTNAPAALQEGLVALAGGDFARAIPLLERAGNPLHISARYYLASLRLITQRESIAVLDSAIRHLRPEYTELASRIHTVRAIALEYQHEYLEAHRAYKVALSVHDDPTTTVEAWSRRSANLATVGSYEQAFRDAHNAVRLLDRVAYPNARQHAYGAAAMCARKLEYPLLALLYQNAAVDEMRKAVHRTLSVYTKRLLAVALRHRAEVHLDLRQDRAAIIDLEEASQLADAVDQADLRNLLQMRIHEVRGQALGSPEELTKAIALARNEDSTYRAVLHIKRASAWRTAGHPDREQEDLDTALTIVRDEAKGLVDTTTRGDHEDLWTNYFLRFEEIHQQMVESRIAGGDHEGAFVYAELARALEPMQILIKSAPPGFRRIENKADLQAVLDQIPETTAILQYLVLKDKTYVWVLTRGKLTLFHQRVARERIQEWVDDAAAAVEEGQDNPVTVAMRGAYRELFEQPLKQAAPSKTRIVIIPDGPMHGLFFPGLQDSSKRYLLERATISIAASTSMYLYALARDQEFAQQRNPSVLLVGDPASGMKPLEYATAEVQELARNLYPGAAVITDQQATVLRFLTQARGASIIHFAGHAVAVPQKPWQSWLALAPQGSTPGELTAETLMKALSPLDRTRLVVLGACSTAGGHSIGPQGLAALVRPLIAANVPAVVGTLSNVNDATTKELLVSLHCHYRHGDDVAVALQKAQLAMLRNGKPARTWAPFQVVGHAGSPYERPAALEEQHLERICRPHSVHRPDGLSSQ